MAEDHDDYDDDHNDYDDHDDDHNDRGEVRLLQPPQLLVTVEPLSSGLEKSSLGSMFST